MVALSFRESAAAIAVATSLAAMVFFAGTFHRGVTALALAVGAVLLLGFAFIGSRCLDPLGVEGKHWRWWPALVVVFWLAVVLSWALSPVGRAGEAIVLFLLPAIWASAGIGRLLGSPGAVRLALGGVALVGLGAASRGLATLSLHEQGRAALPIGHHNQLALVLVALCPAVLLGVWRNLRLAVPRLRVGATCAAGAVMVTALVATGSMSGLLALLVQTAGFAVWWYMKRTGRRLPGALGLLIAVSGFLALAAAWAATRLDVPGPLARVGAVLRLEDPSLLARRTWAEAAFAGFAERPVVGWGPGSTGWTLASHWRPAPGVHPPGEVVTDAHSLLAQAPYEVGAVGVLLLLLLLARYLRARVSDLADPEARDPQLLAAALAGLLGAAVCLMFGVFAVVTAVPSVMVLNLGMVSAARARGVSAGKPGRWRILARACLCVLFVAGLAWTWQRALAVRHYERAISAAAVDDEASALESTELLAAASAADPSFPLYLLRSDPSAAARAARGLAPLWLRAGFDSELDVDSRREALEMACDLDPLSPLAPFELMRLEREAGVAAGDPRVGERAARAILAEPLLLASPAFEGDPDLRAEVYRKVESWPGLPPGWFAAFAERWPGLDWSNGGEGPPSIGLSVDADSDPAVSFSLFAFRRPPWPFSVGAVPLREHRLRSLEEPALPAPSTLPQTVPEPFLVPSCGVG